MKTLDILTYAAFACAMVALPVCVVNFLRYHSKVHADRSLLPASLKARFPIKSVAAFAGSIVVSITAAETSQCIAREEVLRELPSLSVDCSVSIAGRPAARPHDVIEVLRSLHPASPHHSHPNHPIPVRLVPPSHDIELVVSRDSSDPHEYWVFLPRYHVTSKNEIGRVSTDIFDDF